MKPGPWLVLPAACALAGAEPKRGGDDLGALVLPLAGLTDASADTKAPHVFVGLYGGIDVAPGPYERALSPVWTGTVVSTTQALAADRRAAWIAAEVRLDHHCLTGCPKHDPDASSAHVTLLVDGGAPWQPVVVHVATPGTEKDAGAPPAIDRAIEPGAEDVVTLFESTIGDPKAFAATVSDRKDAVLFGSEASERYTGGPTVKKTLQRWALGFHVHDGLHAGVTSSKTVAWIAATVDATSTKAKAKAKPTPYRATFIYERAGGSWRLVAAQFSIYVPTI